MVRIIFFILLTCQALTAFSQLATQSKAVLKPVTIDGDAKEWDTPFGLYEADTRLMFAIANNDSTLYLCFMCPDFVNQDKIMKAGMKVAILRKGKKKINASIIYPLKKTGKEQDVYVEDQMGIGGIKANFLLNNFTMLAEGFATQNGELSVKNTTGIQTAMNWDSINTLVYEMAIPLKELFGNGFEAAELLQELTLNVEIFPVSRPGIESANITGMNSNNGASVINSSDMRNYNSIGGMQGGGNMNGMQGGYPGTGMGNIQNAYYDPAMGSMSGAQQPATWDGSSPPQYKDISGMFEKAEMKQKFMLNIRR